MRRMWNLALPLALFLSIAPGVSAQEEPHLTIRQVEAVFSASEDRPPLTEEAGPSVDGRNVVYEGERGRVYGLHPAIATGHQIDVAEPVSDPSSNGWAVRIQLGGPATARLGNLTSQLACLRDRGDAVKSRLAIVLDGSVLTTLAMAEPSPGGTGGVECGTGITSGELRIDLESRAEAEKLAETWGWPGASQATDRDDRAGGGPIVVPMVLIAAIVLLVGGTAYRRAKRT